MPSNIIIYEDYLKNNFLPISYVRGVFEIKFGMLSMLERINLHFPKAKYHLFSRDYLKPVLAQRYPKYFVNTPNVGLKALIINGRTILTEQVVDYIKTTKDQQYVIVSDGRVVALYLRGEQLSQFFANAIKDDFDEQNILKTFRKEQDVKVVNISGVVVVEDLWSPISFNGELISQDFKLLKKGGLILSDIGTQVALTREDRIYVGKRSKIDPFVHVDASKGPVYIGSHVHIKSNTVIEGPAFIDDHSIIYPGYIRQDTSIGEYCRIGGEVENSIILSYTNKYHAGFLGHSYIGEWVNIGAMTTTSDLKNNYSTVKLEVAPRQSIDSGQQFLGSIIGDYSKFGIGTLLNTGTIIGVGCNVFQATEFLLKWVPSFSWCQGEDCQTYDFDRFIATVEKVYKRRGKQLLLPDKNLLTHVFTNTARLRR